MTHITAPVALITLLYFITFSITNAVFTRLGWETMSGPVPIWLWPIIWIVWIVAEIAAQRAIHNE